MKKFKIIAFFSFMITFSSLYFAQSKHFALQSLQFNKKISAGIISSFHQTETFLTGFPTSEKQLVDLHIEPFHYKAFFCKMELKTVNRLGVWIKVHAGDYDAYARENVSH